MLTVPAMVRDKENLFHFLVIAGHIQLNECSSIFSCTSGPYTGPRHLLTAEADWWNAASTAPKWHLWCWSRDNRLVLGRAHCVRLRPLLVALAPTTRPHLWSRAAAARIWLYLQCLLLITQLRWRRPPSAVRWRPQTGLWRRHPCRPLTSMSSTPTLATSGVLTRPDAGADWSSMRPN